MRIPQVTDRMKEAPTQALRAFFAGIGQFLLVADKNRSGPGGADEAGEAGEAGRAADPAEVSRAEQGRRAAPGPITGSYSSRWRSLDKTGNVRILEPDEHEPEPGTAELPAPGGATGPSEATLASEATGLTEATLPGEATGLAGPGEATEPGEAAGPGEAAAMSAPAELPVANYDSLSLASVRARLRLLDRDQVAVLLDYERTGARRSEFLTMFERRIAKLDSARA